MSAHFTDAELLAYLDNYNETVDVPAAREHIERESCGECLARLAQLRQFKEILRDKTVHDFARRPLALPLPAHLCDARDLVNRQREDDAIAEKTIESLRGLPTEQWLAHLRQAPRSAGLVRMLIRNARGEFDRSPKRVLPLLEVAEEVANALASKRDVAEQRGEIAKTRAEALRMLGKHEAALASLAVAESLLSELPAPAFDLAFVDWVRAGVLFSMSRYAEALRVAQTAIAVFREHGDVDSTHRLRMIEATILCEQGDVEAAHRIFHRLILFFEPKGDREMVARLNANLAECEVRLDRRDVAFEYAADAMRMYEELGYTTEQIRVRWILGHALLRAGETHEALEELRSAGDAFERLGMTADAALVGLDLAELHLSRGDWKEAESLARDLANRFAVAGAPVHRTRAFAYLREAVAAGSPAPDLLVLLEYLRSYLNAADLDEEPLPFEPPTGDRSA